MSLNEHVALFAVNYLPGVSDVTSFQL